MSWIVRFWKQEHKAYRNFQLVYTFFTLHFFIPAFLYVVDPKGAYEGFTMLGRLLGAETYPVSEQSYIWRILGAANVFTLGLLCLLLQLDVKRNRPVLFPLCFLKGMASFLFLVHFVFVERYPAFLVVGLYDALNVTLFIVCARAALRSIEARPHLAPVPALRHATRARAEPAA